MIIGRNIWARLKLIGADKIMSSAQHLSPFYEQSRGTRRTTSLAPWGIGRRLGYTPQNLTPQNEAFLKEITEDVYDRSSPLLEEPWLRGVWNPNSMRTGVICKKIGYLPQWNKKGERIIVTLLQVADNHAVKYIDPDTWVKTSRRGKKFGKGKFGCMVVGADSHNPQLFTAGYRGLFGESGVMPKKRLHSFLITPDAKIQPGTKIVSTHFRPGQHVDAYGRSQGHGFQGVMKRWRFKGGKADKHGTTKQHRRPGAIGTQGDAMVKPGKRLPGRMGFEFRITRGLKIWRINTQYNVLYVHGNGIPGPTHHYVLLRDSIIEGKRNTNPAFPTHFPEEDAEPLPEELFDSELFEMTDDSILYDAIEMKKPSPSAKVKKQAKLKK